ncbi:putative membrane protein YukC [Bradyrhizobium elkanii]|nr:putative membrane protein YukC [Bradyrhizobium elkanii]
MPYLVMGTNEYGSANLGRGSATVALRLARKLLRNGYMDVRVCTPRGRILQSDELNELEPQQEMDIMAKGQQRGNREAKKPKKEKAKVIAAQPSRKEVAWQPDFGPARKR